MSKLQSQRHPALTQVLCVDNQKPSARRPRRKAAASGDIMMRAAPPIEEAPGARAGPRSPDAFYRGEEAGAALKTTATDSLIQHYVFDIPGLKSELTGIDL